MAVQVDMRIQREAPNYQNVHKKMILPPSPQTDPRNKGAFCLAGVCIGLMCIIQATLNIVLRLYLPSHVLTTIYCENNTLAEDTELLQNQFNALYEEKNQLENHFLILDKEREKLQMERNQLQDKLSDIAADLSEWVSFRSRFYYMSTERRSWTESRDDCARRNAKLVIVTSRGVQDFVEKLRGGKAAWIGLSDRDEEGVWKWVDGSPLITPYWWTREPNNYKGNEDCVETGYNPDDGRKVIDVLNTWNDNVCSLRLFWICEKAISV